MNSKFVSLPAVGFVPSLVVALAYFLLLGHRRDYLGHYAAGYGATLCGAAIVLAVVSAERLARFAGWAVAAGTVLCIAAGTVTEATLFRLAKFDEVDFCNQSLGAVVAGLAAVQFASRGKPADDAVRGVIATGILFLLAGAYFAVT